MITVTVDVYFNLQNIHFKFLLVMTEIYKKKQKQRDPSRKKMAIEILINIWVIIHSWLDCLIDFVFGLIYDKTRVHLPPVTDEILLESAVSLARRIRNKEITASQVVNAFITRIKNVNGVLNAVVDERFEEAIEDAKRIDEQIQNQKISYREYQQKPFLGVPFTSKESTACQGLSYTLGLLCRKGTKAKEDAEIVKLTKEAGGILLGVTNIPQINLWMESMNPVFGTTNNPYNTTRNAGGSSGGEASIVAACGAPIGLGTDIGGSIRIPAFMCGVFGHKVSSGLTSTRGLTYRTGLEARTMVSSGPITRFAEDLAPLTKILVGSKIDKLKLDEKVDVGKLKFFYIDELKDPKCSSIRKEMSDAFQKVVQHFEEISGEIPVKLEIGETKYSWRLWRYWMSQEPEANFCRDIANRKKEVNPIIEILKYLIGKSEYNLAVIFNLVNQILPSENEKWAKETTERLQEKLSEILDENSVLLYPSGPWTASYHYTAFLRPYNASFFNIFNVLQLPVTQVPLGLDKDGLPMGIQVVAGPFKDHLCFAVAENLEKTFGGYVPPFKIEK